MPIKILKAAAFSALLGAFFMGIFCLGAPAQAQQSSAFVVAPCVTATGASNGSGKVPGCAPITSSNPLPISGSISATFAPFAPNGNFATPLTVGATSSNVALPGGTAVGIYNTGTTAAFVNLGVGAGTTATASDHQVAPGGFLCFAVGSNTYLAAIETAGATTLNIGGGAGGCAGSGGGGGGGGGGGTVSQGPGNPANPWTITPLTGSTFGVFPSGTFTVATNIDQGTNSIAIDSATAGTAQLIAAPGSGAIYITQWWVSAPSGTFKLVYGTGSNCGTGTTELFGPVTMNGGQSGAGGGAGSILFVPAGNALCEVLSASVQYSGSVSYLNR